MSAPAPHLTTHEGAERAPGAEDARPTMGLRALEALTTFLSGYRFAAVVVSLVLGFAGLVVLVLVVPDDAGVFGAFARDFKVWCFDYDPVTGDMPATLAVMMLSELVAFAALVALLWWGPLRDAVRARWGSLARWSCSGLGLAFGLGALLVALGTPTRADDADPLGALRTALPTPALALTDHRGAPISLGSLGSLGSPATRDGKVVLVTAVYSTCGATCPMIMGQAKRAFARLTPAQAARLEVVAVTLDPAHDTQPVLAEMARAQGIDDKPNWHLVTGDPAVVEATLDRWGFGRRRDPKTGVIEHANLFILIDGAGRQAFRLSLGGAAEGRDSWLADALVRLVDEPAGVP